MNMSAQKSIMTWFGAIYIFGPPSFRCFGLWPAASPISPEKVIAYRPWPRAAHIAQYASKPLTSELSPPISPFHPSISINYSHLRPSRSCIYYISTSSPVAPPSIIICCVSPDPFVHLYIHRLLICGPFLFYIALSPLLTQHFIYRSS